VLLLFDIDGTLLLKAAAEHKAALYEGLRVAHGRTFAAIPVETAGRTDPAIARSILVNAGVDAAAIDRRRGLWADATCEAYARACPRDLTDKVAPGVPEALETLRGAGHTCSLVTGNLEPIARLKLGRAGLGTCFARGQGGFGSDHEDRAALPEVARRRASLRAHEGRHHAHARRDTVVIGDTPLDIACARADGVRVIAIATGPFGVAALQDADIVVRHAGELPAAVARLAAG
jgi:phosphoglycolate phosphatase-like HAD superfamily hydrolase